MQIDFPASLSQDQWSVGRHTKSRHVKDAIFRAFPLWNYAAETWPLYACEAEKHSEAVRAAILDFLLKNDQSLVNRQKLLRLYGEAKARPGEAKNDALYYASFCGLAVSVKALLEQGVDVNASSKNGLHGLALCAACEGGHEKVVELLLENKVDVNARSSYKEKTALHLAAKSGRKTIVGMLLDKGAIVHAWDKNGVSVLELATSEGQENIVQMLLGTGVDAFHKNGSYSRSLRSAAGLGYKEIVQLLLDNSLDVDQGAPHVYGLALMCALGMGCKDIVPMLLEHGADISEEQIPHARPILIRCRSAIF